jgi:uncharacterized protein YsxB (DUF464 family)
MIEVLIDRIDGHPSRLKVSGHARFDAYGKDIVCAAISVLTQTCLIALNDVAKIENIMYSVDEETGLLTFELPNCLEQKQREQANVIIESILVGIKSTQATYPDYIRIIEREVRPNDVKNESSTLCE